MRTTEYVLLRGISFKPGQNKKLSYRRETARCFTSLNISLSHSRSLQCHSKWHLSVWRIVKVTISIPLWLSSRFSNRFWDIQLQRMALPRNLGWEWFTVIENGTIRKLGTVFWLHSTVTVSISCIIAPIKRDIGQKSLFFICRLHSTPSLAGGGGFVRTFGIEKLEWCGYPTVKKKSTEYQHVMDRQTDGRTDRYLSTA